MTDTRWDPAAETLATTPSGPDSTAPITTCPEQSSTVSWDPQAAHLPRCQAPQAAVVPWVIRPCPSRLLSQLHLHFSCVLWDMQCVWPALLCPFQLRPLDPRVWAGATGGWCE